MASQTTAGDGDLILPTRVAHCSAVCGDASVVCDERGFRAKV